MPTSLLARTLIFAEHEHAEQLVTLLCVITGTPEPTWTGHQRRDGSRTVGAVVPFGDSEIEVRIGWPAAPAVLEVATDRPLEEVRDAVADAVGSCMTWPNDPDAPIKRVTARVGEAIAVKVVAR